MGYVGDFLAKELNIEDPIMFRSISSAAYFYSYAIAQIPTGVLLDSLGILRYGFIGVVVMAFGGFLSAFALDYPMVVLSRAIIGFGAAVVFVGIQRYIGKYYPISLSASLTSLASIIGNVGAIYAQFPMVILAYVIGVRGSLLSLAILTVISAALIPLTIRDRGLESTNISIGLKKTVKCLSIVMRNPHSLSLFTAVFIGYGTLMLLQTIILRDYAIDTLGLGMAEASSLIVAVTIGYIIGSMIAGVLSDRIVKARKPFLQYAYLTTAIMMP